MWFAPLTNQVLNSPSESFCVPLSESHSNAPNRSIIPGTTLQWVYDSTSLMLLQGCLRKYNFRLLQGWQQRELPPPLAWGRDFHTCKETYHKCIAVGLDHETAVLRTTKLAMLLGERLLSLDTSRTKETLVRSVVWYLEEYKDDPLKTALLPDGSPAVELSFMLPVFDIEVGPTDELPPLNLQDIVLWFNGKTGRLPSQQEMLEIVSEGRRLFGKIDWDATPFLPYDYDSINKSFYSITIHFSGHIDRVVHFGDEVFITDYKSSKYALDSDWIKGFDMSLQFEGYYTAAQIMSSLPNSVFPSPPAGIIVDGLQLQVNGTRFARFPLRYHPSTAEDFLTNFEALIRTKAEPAARLNMYPREAESECNHYRRRDGTGGCEFRKVCLGPPISRTVELKRNFTRSTWDPSQSR
jgi:hypothetical protein